MQSLTVLLQCVVCVCALEEFSIEIDDVLNANLMPGSLLVLDNDMQYATRNVSEDGGRVFERNINGSLDDAYGIMSFHRKMMNEYLCNNFIADEIISTFDDSTLLSDRFGKPFSKPEQLDLPSLRFDVPHKDAKQENLLSDAGSLQYKDWLAKTATLEDIYRHYQRSSPRTKGDRRDDTIDDFEDRAEEYPLAGDVTGYAYPQPSGVPSVSAGKHDYIYGPQLYHHQDHYSVQEDHGHGFQLTDIFDIALTALAFLSFGMFVLQVIMCITANKQQPMMAMVEDTAGNGDVDVEDIRFRRGAAPRRSDVINEIARRVLTSVEAARLSYEDDGACLRVHICDNNRFSTRLADEQRIWTPVFNLALSWVSGRLASADGEWPRSLEALRASALGLGGADCLQLLPECRSFTRKKT